MHALYNSSFFQFGLWHTAYTVGAEIRVTRLYAAQAAQILVTRFLPFGYQIGVGDFLIDTVVVQLAADCFSAIVQVVDVA